MMKNLFKSRSCMNAIFIVVCILLIALIVLLSLTPPISRDALVHHLAVPKLYLKHGGIYEIPFMPFSYYPMNLDLLYMIPLYFGSDIIPKFIHFSFALLTAALIFIYLRKRLNIVYAFFGTIFFLSVPIVVKLSISAYVDLGVMFFSMASLICLFRWIESGYKLKPLLLAAFCCGLALGTKYNALITLTLLTLFVPFIYSRYRKGKRPKFFRSAGQGLVFLFVALLVVSPWMIRNYKWTGNPVYPLYNNFFNPPKRPSGSIISSETVVKQNRGFLTYRRMMFKEKWWEMVLLPVRIFFQGKDGNPQYFDGKLHPFLLILPMFAFWRFRDESLVTVNEKKIMLWFVVLFFGFSLFSSVLRIRYLSPIIPPLIILSVFGVNRLFKIVEGLGPYGTRIAEFLIPSIVAFCLIMNANYIVNQFKYLTPISYINGTLSRDEYISRFYPEHPGINYINKNLPSDSRILFIFLGKRGYYCEREYVLDNQVALRRIIRKSDDPYRIREALRKSGITHLYIQMGLFEKWVQNNFDGKDKILLQKFFVTCTKPLYFKNGFGVFELRNECL
jgi:hypothetical protein